MKNNIANITTANLLTGQLFKKSSGRWSGFSSEYRACGFKLMSESFPLLCLVETKYRWHQFDTTAITKSKLSCRCNVRRWQTWHSSASSKQNGSMTPPARKAYHTVTMPKHFQVPRICNTAYSRSHLGENESHQKWAPWLKIRLLVFQASV